jgi:hypothetical protein
MAVVQERPPVAPQPAGEEAAVLKRLSTRPLPAAALAVAVGVFGATSGQAPAASSGR